MPSPVFTPRSQTPSTASQTDTTSPRRDDVSDATSASNARSEVQFQFVTGDHESDEDESGTDEEGQRNNENVPSQHKSLIEDIYNVERREDQPRKRIKTTNEEKVSAAGKSQFNMAGNSGLGEFMKEGRQLEGISKTAVVDLTTGSL